ncbi:MAG: YfiR family protein [Nitrospirales bacterium]|nr:YfiR family protein [Nitrospira sp.]MDR4500529.1 YfiR family protein [Nitrospirales bacterium]
MTFSIVTPSPHASPVVMVIGLVIALCWPCHTIAESSMEYNVKSAFLYHFSQFTEWPDEVLTNEDKFIHVCHFGERTFIDFLERTLDEKLVQSRRFRVHHNVSSAQIHTCQVVFVDEKTAKHSQKLQEILQKSTGLIVGESRGFLEQGGMIQFFHQDNKIRFAVNPDALEAKHIRLSSKLLRLAKIIRIQ